MRHERAARSRGTREARRRGRAALEGARRVGGRRPDHLARLTNFTGENVARLFTRARTRLGDRANEPGSVPPRALHRILEDAAYTDDVVVTEYLAGVLATARTPDGKDDSALAWTALIGRMPSRHLRLHFVLYAGLRDSLLGSGLNLGDLKTVHSKARLFVAWPDLVRSVGGDPTQAVVGLLREGLISDRLALGTIETLHDAEPHAPDAGLIWYPTIPGVLLFLWGHGLGEEAPNSILDPDAPLDSDLDITVPRALTRNDLAELAGVQRGSD